MTALSDNRLVKAFAELKAAGGKTLLPFVTAGYPDLETTTALLGEFERRGVRVCELGIPFSDPIADG
ncbi:MAG TPA: tryptophan synthase subunit alpha, partial [Phycisphaerales bacterium]|nr:tryptophan synthase subunit alpha [Phycisphaerales bacterium]